MICFILQYTTKMSMYCKHCGKEIADDSIFCPICGTKQKDCYCRNCGKEIPSESSFCPFCGTKQKSNTLNTISHAVHKIVNSIKSMTEPEASTETNTSPVEENTATINKTKEEVHNESTAINNSPLKECHFIEKETLSDESLGYWPQNNIGIKYSDTKDKTIANNYSEQNNDNELNYDYKAMPLLPRFCGSLIDKFLIVVFFVLTNIAIHPYKSAQDLGIYQSMLGANPANYEYIDRANINGSNGITDLYGAPPFIGQTSNFDIKMTSFFVATYLLYYFILEILFNSSLGKKMLGGHLLIKNSNKIQQRHILIRALIRGVLFFTTIWICHFVIGFTYYFVLVILLLIIDVPILFCHRSTIDICSGTCYMERGEQTATPIHVHNDTNEVTSSPTINKWIVALIFHTMVILFVYCIYYFNPDRIPWYEKWNYLGIGFFLGAFAWLGAYIYDENKNTDNN